MIELSRVEDILQTTLDGKNIPDTFEPQSRVEELLIGLCDIIGGSAYIEDTFSTLAALRAAYPHGNKKAYQVTAENNEIFIWSETAQDWISIGTIRGPKGDKGDPGNPGAKGDPGTVFTPSVSQAGVLSWSNDGGLPNPASVDIAAAVINAIPLADSTQY